MKNNTLGHTTHIQHKFSFPENLVRKKGEFKFRSHTIRHVQNTNKTKHKPKNHFLLCGFISGKIIISIVKEHKLTQTGASTQTTCAMPMSILLLLV